MKFTGSNKKNEFKTIKTLNGIGVTGLIWTADMPTFEKELHKIKTAHFVSITYVSGKSERDLLKIHMKTRTD